MDGENKCLFCREESEETGFLHCEVCGYTPNPQKWFEAESLEWFEQQAFKFLEDKIFDHVTSKTAG